MDRQIFDHLSAATGEMLVSIYLPTQFAGNEINQGRIRLKNSLANAEAALHSVGWKPGERADLLKQARDLLEDREFWQHQRSGLAVFVDAEGESTQVALSAGANELTVVADSFHLRQMIPSLEPVELSVLVLTMHGVRLYRASRYDASEVTADFPRSFEDVNWFVDREKQRQQHPDQAGSKGQRHGHEPSQARHEDLERFLRAVDDAIPGSDPHEALVVLADDDLVARYSVVSDREILAGGHIGDVNNRAGVLEVAAEVIKKHEAELNGRLIDLGREHLGRGTAITELTEALEAAVTGRIDRLLLTTESVPVWGRFDPSTLEVIKVEERTPLLVDLLDRLVVHAMSTGAEVTAMEGSLEGYDFVGIPRF